MKKLLSTLPLFVILLLTSCTSTQKIPLLRSVVMIDYTKYAEKGFFLSESNSVSFEYTPIGSVSVVLMDGYELQTEKPTSANYPDQYAYTPKTTYGDKPTRFTVYDALDLAIKKANESGANGIINLRVSIGTALTSTYSDDLMGEYSHTKGNSYTITGMAIKR